MANPSSASVSISTTNTFTDRNRDWFDTAVSENCFGAPWIQDLSKLISSKLREKYGWFGVRQRDGGVRLLDYACGTGVASMAISSYITQAIGIDLSANMVAAYNTAAQEKCLTENMFAIQGDFLSPSTSTTDPMQDPKLFNFDLIILSMALHHIQDTQLIITKLQERLNEGGVLVIVDWLSMGTGGAGEEEKQLTGAHTVAHFGFSEEGMKAHYEKAGMVDVDFMEGIEKSKVPAEMGGEQQVFIAKARKAGRQ